MGHNISERTLGNIRNPFRKSAPLPGGPYQSAGLAVALAAGLSRGLAWTRASLRPWWVAKPSPTTPPAMPPAAPQPPPRLLPRRAFAEAPVTTCAGWLAPSHLLDFPGFCMILWSRGPGAPSRNSPCAGLSWSSSPAPDVATSTRPERRSPTRFQEPSTWGGPRHDPPRIVGRGGTWTVAERGPEATLGRPAFSFGVEYRRPHPQDPGHDFAGARWDGWAFRIGIVVCPEGGAREKLRTCMGRTCTKQDVLEFNSDNVPNLP